MMDSLARPVSEGVGNFYKDGVDAGCLKVAPILGDDQRQCALGVTVCLARAHVYIQCVRILGRGGIDVETNAFRRHPLLIVYGTKSSVGCRGSAAYYQKYDAKKDVSHFKYYGFAQVRSALNVRRVPYV